MIERKLRLILALVLLCLAASFIAGCSSGEKEVKPAEYLLEQAEQQWAKKKWAKAADSYGQIRDYYPYHDQATLAQFRAAEALYRSEKYQESLAAFETFDELHPTYPQHPMVLLRMGQCHFRLSRGIDRDQVETHNAIKYLSRVTKRFPDTDEGKEAAELIRRAYLKLVRHELYIARFYRKTKAYQSAIGRFEKALSYPDVGYNEILQAELAITKALAEGKKKPRIKVPPEPKDDRVKWWKIWK